LQKAGVYDAVKPKLVYGENISQAAQFVQSGNAELGILAVSLTFAGSMTKGQRWEVPADLYPPLEQAAVLMSVSANKNAARKFLEFIQSTEVRDVLSKYGFSVPARVKNQ
jgi:molybdate transport system substrate-binding protein